MKGINITMYDAGVLMLLENGSIQSIQECVEGSTVKNTTATAKKYYNTSLTDAIKIIEKEYPEQYIEYTNQFPKPPTDL